jgi:hypothetical protein
VLGAASDSVLVAFSIVVLGLGWLALPVIWWFFFRGKKDGPKSDGS